MKVDAATNAMIFDILKNILSFAEKPDELGKYITTQLRELVGAKMVLLILNSEDQQQNNHKLIGICPERKRERIELNHVQQIATLCQSFHVPTLVEHSDNAGETGKLLMHFTGNTSIIVPLEYASKSIGVLLMIDIFDTNNLSSVLDSLESLSGVLALELRNGQFFEILKSEVEKRTIELHESEEKFHRYIERAPDGILVIDSNGYYIDVNKAACDLLGYNRAEILTMHASKIRLAEESKKVNEAIDIQNAKGFFNDEVILVRKDGSTFSALLSAVKISDDQFLGFVKNIDDIKQAQRDLIKAKEHAEESDHLKTAFLQNMSHEIRTPMNAIMGFSDLLPDQYGNRPKLEKYSKIINQRCNDLLEIINDILDIAKIESGQLQVNMEECNPDGLFKELDLFFREHRTTIGKQSVEFSCKTIPDGSDIHFITDKVKLKQIFINLIGNAFKFTDQGSIEIGYRFETDQTLLFYVKDTGIGIPGDKQGAVFERFTQLNESKGRIYGGTGLGLSIVKGLIELLGGKIWLESKSGLGTTFYFSLPYTPSSPIQQSADMVEDTQAVYASDKTILIVEDDLFNAEYLTEALAGNGFGIHRVENGNTAIQMALNHPLDLILMDMRLPDMSGLEASRIIKQNNPSVKIIAQTSYASHEDHKKSIEAGCSDYISKPINRKLLLKIIGKLLNTNSKY